MDEIWLSMLSNNMKKLDINDEDDISILINENDEYKICVLNLKIINKIINNKNIDFDKYIDFNISKMMEYKNKICYNPANEMYADLSDIG